MELKRHDINGVCVAEIISENVELREVQDALDLIADAGYQGFDALIIHEKNIAPDFFDLKTRWAGEVLQKFTQYNFRIAIVGDFSKFSSKSLRDFIYESNKGKHVNFLDSVEAAVEVFSR